MLTSYSGRRDRSPEHEVDTPLSPLLSSPMSPLTLVESDPIAQRLAVLQKRLDIEMKVCPSIATLVLTFIYIYLK